MKRLVDVRGLEVVRAGRTVLSLPRLTIAQGEVLALMGPNGAGKSTLLLAIAGLLPPTRGEIWFAGERLTRRNALALRRRMALVLQEPQLLSTTVWNNVALGLRFRRLPRPEIRQRTETWLERLGIAHLAQRRAGQLSGGEAQRVSLARAFALEPDLLLLDEPFSALDTETRADLIADLRHLLAASGATALLVTHYEEEARQLATRTLRLVDGKPAD